MMEITFADSPEKGMDSSPKKFTARRTVLFPTRNRK